MANEEVLPTNNSVAEGDVKQGIQQVVTPVNNQNWCSNWNPKTKVWKDLLGWDKDGNEVWKISTP